LMSPSSIGLIIKAAGNAAKINAAPKNH